MDALSAEWATALLTGVGVLFAGIGLYVGNVFERHQLVVTPVSSDLSNQQFRVELLLTNRGNRQLALLQANPIVGNKGGGGRGGPTIDNESTTLPMVVPAGEIRRVVAVTAFDIREEWSLIDGELKPDGGKVARLILSTTVLDSRGQQRYGSTAFGVITVESDVVKLAGDLQPQTILDVRHWLGPLL